MGTLAEAQQRWTAEVAEHAVRLGVPGVAAGVLMGGRQHVAVHGTTSVENPLPVDANTLFQIGSTGKTFTATAMLRLVEQGKVDLDERVRVYLPDLRLADESVAAELRVLHLLTHTAGFEGDRMADTGEGDDALAAYVATFADRPQLLPPGGPPSYNNAALALAGRVIEVVTGRTFERAIEELLLEPLGLDHTLLRLNDIMTRSFAVGHEQHDDGTVSPARPWSMARAEVPVGGRIAASVRDQLAWARFHLGDGRAPDGTRLLSTELLRRMQRAHATRGRHQSYGIVWKLREQAGTRVVEHGGAVPGQHSAFLMVPDQDYAVVVLTNCHPNGQALWREIVRLSLQAHLGLVEPEPVARAMSAVQLARYAGTYGFDSMLARITVSGTGLVLETDSPEMAAHARAAGKPPPVPFPPMTVGLTDDQSYVVLDGAHRGMRGEFLLEGDEVTAVTHFGRLLPRRHV
ncbi:MAG: serine hydrolase domain-containing protein [bacterium]